MSAAVSGAPSETSLVFLDPDTGLEPKKKPKLEHVLEAELRDIWRAMRPGDVLVFYQHETNKAGRPWVEVGAYPIHEGTLLRTARGVFSAGVVGSFYVGQKREDGTVDRSTEDDWPEWVDPSKVGEAEVVFEYADPPEGYPEGCERMADGTIHCVCEEDWGLC